VEGLEALAGRSDKPADQASRVGRPIEDIRRARERIKYALRVAIDVLSPDREPKFGETETVP